MNMIASKPFMGLTPRPSLAITRRSVQKSLTTTCKAAVSPRRFQDNSESKHASSRVIPLLSELVEVQVSIFFAASYSAIDPNIKPEFNLQAATTSFETFAGRSAMIGFAVAAAAESLAGPGKGLFGESNSEQLVAFGILCASMIVSSSMLAFISTRVSSSIFNKQKTIGIRFLEPVIASLTSLSRSQGAVSQKVNVDSALDSAMETVFSSSFVETAFPIMENDDNDVTV